MKLALKNKILIGVSAFLMAICCVLGITSMQKASAQSEEIKLEIISNNVSNDDATYVLYAVYSEGVDKTENQITMLFWTELPWVRASTLNEFN
jgi:YbbR domain-containing protein